ACMFFLLFGREPYNLYDSYWESLKWNINLAPFFTIGSQWRAFVRAEYDIFSFAGINLIGNVIMFIPLGICLPALWKRLRSYGRFAFCVAAIILAVELVQLFTLRGSFDIDDLILNVVGASVGFAVFQVGSFILEWGERKL
ncbi:MAG: VanZ family protein, partial [Lachnospiraceae bacterium]|nr:VanZ family protein [Lachnospiraceae bacterium]